MKTTELVFPLTSANVFAGSGLIVSTTGGDGITFTSLLPGAWGNKLSIQYLTPAGATTTVALTGSNGFGIVVSPKAGETNTGLLAAVVAACPFVSGVVTVGGDLVIAVARTNFTGGVSGVTVTTESAVDAQIGIMPGVHYYFESDTDCWINIDAAAVASANMPLFAKSAKILKPVDAAAAGDGKLHTVHVIAGGAGKLYLTPLTGGNP